MAFDANFWAKYNFGPQDNATTLAGTDGLIEWQRRFGGADGVGNEVPALAPGDQEPPSTDPAPAGGTNTLAPPSPPELSGAGMGLPTPGNLLTPPAPTGAAPSGATGGSVPSETKYPGPAPSAIPTPNIIGSPSAYGTGDQSQNFSSYAPLMPQGQGFGALLAASGGIYGAGGGTGGTGGTYLPPISGGMVGGTTSGAPSGPGAVAPPNVSPGPVGEKVLSEYSKAQTEAKDANESRYQDILGRLEGGYAEGDQRKDSAYDQILAGYQDRAAPTGTTTGGTAGTGGTTGATRTTISPDGTTTTDSLGLREANKLTDDDQLEWANNMLQGAPTEAAIAERVANGTLTPEQAERLQFTYGVAGGGSGSIFSGTGGTPGGTSTGGSSSYSGQGGSDPAILGGYNDRYYRALDNLSNLGQQESKDVSSRYAKQRASSTQSLISRGLGNTTVTDAIDRGLQEGESTDQRRLSENLRQQLLGYDANLSGDTLGYMERARQQAVSSSQFDQNQALQQQQLDMARRAQEAGLTQDQLAFMERYNQSFQYPQQTDITGFMERRVDSYPDMNQLIQLMMQAGVRQV